MKNKKNKCSISRASMRKFLNGGNVFQNGSFVGGDPKNNFRGDMTQSKSQATTDLRKKQSDSHVPFTAGVKYGSNAYNTAYRKGTVTSYSPQLDLHIAKDLSGANVSTRGNAIETLKADYARRNPMPGKYDKDGKVVLPEGNMSLTDNPKAQYKKWKDGQDKYISDNAAKVPFMNMSDTKNRGKHAWNDVPFNKGYDNAELGESTDEMKELMQNEINLLNTPEGKRRQAISLTNLGESFRNKKGYVSPPSTKKTITVDNNTNRINKTTMLNDPRFTKLRMARYSGGYNVDLPTGNRGTYVDPAYGDSKSDVISHEMGHNVAGGREKDSDRYLKANIKFKKNPTSSYMLKTADEATAVLRQTRQQMVEDGFIRHPYDEITKETLQKAYDFYDKNNVGGTTYGRNTYDDKAVKATEAEVAKSKADFDAAKNEFNLFVRKFGKDKKGVKVMRKKMTDAEEVLRQSSSRDNAAKSKSKSKFKQTKKVKRGRFFQGMENTPENFEHLEKVLKDLASNNTNDGTKVAQNGGYTNNINDMKYDITPDKIKQFIHGGNVFQAGGDTLGSKGEGDLQAGADAVKSAGASFDLMSAIPVIGSIPGLIENGKSAMTKGPDQGRGRGAFIGGVADTALGAFGIPTMGVGEKLGGAIGGAIGTNQNSISSVSQRQAQEGGYSDNLTQYFKAGGETYKGPDPKKLDQWYNSLGKAEQDRLWAMDMPGSDQNTAQYKKFVKWKEHVFLKKDNNARNPKVDKFLQAGGNTQKKEIEIEGNEFVYDKEGVNQLENFKMKNNSGVESVSPYGLLAKGDKHSKGGIKVDAGNVYIGSDHLGMDGKKSSKKNISVAKTLLKNGGDVLAKGHKTGDRFGINKHNKGAIKHHLSMMDAVVSDAEQGKEIEKITQEIDRSLKQTKQLSKLDNNRNSKKINQIKTDTDMYNQMQMGGNVSDALSNYLQTGNFQEGGMTPPMPQDQVAAQSQAPQGAPQQGGQPDEQQVMQMAQAAVQGDQQAMQALKDLVGEEQAMQIIQQMQQEIAAQQGPQGGAQQGAPQGPSADPSGEHAQQLANQPMNPAMEQSPAAAANPMQGMAKFGGYMQQGGYPGMYNMTPVMMMGGYPAVNGYPAQVGETAAAVKPKRKKRKKSNKSKTPKSMFKTGYDMVRNG